MQYSISEFEGVYTRYFPPAMRLAMSLLHDEDEARDVVQETFVKLWESDIEIKTPQAYIIRAVRNGCLNRIAATDTRARFKMGYSLEPPDEEPYSEQRYDDIKEAVATLLTEREQQIVERVYSRGMSYKEAAESLNVSVALVNKCLVSALKTLRTRFKNND